MESTLDKTTLSTISLLEARVRRVEHLLYGASEIPSPSPQSAVESIADLERRFTSLLGRVRVYAELLKIYNAHPSLFQPQPPASPPTQLSPEALQATVLSYAAAFPSTASALIAITSDTPVPEPALSANLASLLPRMRGIEATQRAQEAEIAELRARSELLVKQWYQGRVLQYGQLIAGVDGRLEKVERAVRRAEKVRMADEEGV